MKKFIAIFMVFMLLFLTTACSGGKTERSDEMTNSSTTQPKVESVDVKEFSFFSLDANDESLKLTDVQRTVLAYYNYQGIGINNAEALIRYPQQFRGIRINFEACIQKIIESNDQTYTIIAEMPEQYNEEHEHNDYNKSVVIHGAQTEERFIVGDWINCEGVFEDSKDYTVDGISYQLPTIKNIDFTLLYGDGDTDKSLDNVAKALFSNDVTTRAPIEGIDYNPNEGYGEYYYRVVEFPSGDQENSFEISETYHQVIKEDSTNNTYSTLYPAADFENYYLVTRNGTSNLGRLEYVTSNFKTVWSRDIDDMTSFRFDYNRKTLMYIQGNDFYIVNVKDGKDIVDPVYVGERSSFMMTNDGSAILVGSGEKDNVIKVDKSGKIVWRADIPLSISYGSVIKANSDGSTVLYLNDDTICAYLSKVEADGSYSNPILVYGY